MKVLYEDNHLLIIDKEAGILSQGDKTNDVSAIELSKQYIKEKYNKPGEVFLGLVHRLDRPVSGILVFARTSKALTRMNNIFNERSVEKEYLAICENKPHHEKGTIKSHLYRNEKNNKTYISNVLNPKAKLAILDYEYIGSSEKYHLIKVNLHTGRHHQIRVQLASKNCIIKGDLKYGAKRSNNDKSISLHAYKIKFIHPITKEEINIESIPENKDVVWDYFNKLYISEKK